ncbi:cyclin-D-binding Myb-like transcription factor 1 [Sinocyclocheilus grahami]|uniref:cyclin-D-binding Myb-like transcription factor 1 n=1 Tax=Sinocyclocheilus grahami TaxID=75366 RepID=UPI0007ACE4F5|nr:PREDICTED: cyclin-D-binding Myb-like transcription factor 1 [Sinocyclocheilus grahami]
MSHPGIIIQTVTSEDLSDPLGQSELEGEQELEKEEPLENQNNSGEEEQSEERSNDVQEEEKTLDSPKVVETVESSGMGEEAVLMVPSPSSFIPTNEDISTDSVLPLGTLTGQSWL